MSNISVEDITQLIQTKVREATDPLLAKIVELTDHVHEQRSTYMNSLRKLMM